MPKVRQLDPGASPMAFFGAEVRRARLAARMSLADLGALAFCDASTVSRYESADLPPDETFAATCDRAFPAAGGWFTRFFTAHWTWDASPFPAAFRSFAVDEARASALYLSQHSLIPGLFQTEDYARHVLSRHPNVTEELVSARVAARMARQSVLDREDPPLVWAVIDDAALTRCVGSPEVMHAAITRLAAMARRARVTIQVLDSPGAHVGLQGGCSIAEIAGSSSSVALDDINDGSVSGESAAVTEASVRFRWLQAEALSTVASLALIEQRAGQWQNRTPKDGARLLTAVPEAETAPR